MKFTDRKLIKKLYSKKNKLKIHLRIRIIIAVLTGYIVSFGLYKLFHLRMWARYPIAMLVSYFFGIFLIHIWVKKYFDNRGILDYRAADKSADNKQNNIQIDEAGCFEDILEAVFGLLFVVILIIAGLIWLLNVLIDYILFSLLINYLLKKSKSAPLQLSESSFGGFIFKKSLMQVFILVLVVGTGSFFIQHFFPKIQTFGDMFDPVFLKLNKLWFMINS